MTAHTFHPPRRRLMGPGPSDVHPRVLAAMAQTTIGHLDPAFVAMMDDLKELLRNAFQTRNELTIPVSGPGSVGMETCFVNLVEPGDTVVVCENGAFGGRMSEIVRRCGAIPIVVENAWGEPMDPDKVEKELKAHPEAKALAFVHAETSTGAQSDAAALCRLGWQYGALTIVDCVTSLGGIPVAVDDWCADAVYSGSQKCLSCPPGLSPLTFSERAVEAIKARKQPIQSWFLDLSLVMGYWGEGAARSYHHTAPINALYGLHESLVMLAEEGLENSWARHRESHLALRAGIEALGLELLVEEPFRLPQLNAVRVPARIKEASVRRHLLNECGIEIGAGLGALSGKIWRVGLMGQSATPEHVFAFLDGLEDALTAQGSKFDQGRGVAAAQAAADPGRADAEPRQATAT